MPAVSGSLKWLQLESLQPLQTERIVLCFFSELKSDSVSVNKRRITEPVYQAGIQLSLNLIPSVLRKDLVHFKQFSFFFNPLCFFIHGKEIQFTPHSNPNERTFKGHLGPDICLLQEQTPGILQNLNADNVAARDVSTVEMQKKIFLYNCTVPPLTLSGPVFTGRGKIKISYLSAQYLWWVYNNKISSSLIHFLLNLTDRVQTG